MEKNTIVLHKDTGNVYILRNVDDYKGEMVAQADNLLDTTESKLFRSEDVELLLDLNCEHIMLDEYKEVAARLNFLNDDDYNCILNVIASTIEGMLEDDYTADDYFEEVLKVTWEEDSKDPYVGLYNHIDSLCSEVYDIEQEYVESLNELERQEQGKEVCDALTAIKEQKQVEDNIIATEMQLCDEQIQRHVQSDNEEEERLFTPVYREKTSIHDFFIDNLYIIFAIIIIAVIFASCYLGGKA